jgi:hypothetical protein
VDGIVDSSCYVSFEVLLVSFSSSKPETIRFNDVLDGEQSAHSYYLQSSRLLDEIDGRKGREANMDF